MFFMSNLTMATMALITASIGIMFRWVEIEEIDDIIEENKVKE